MWRVTGGLALTAGLATALLIWPSHRPSPRGGSVAAAQVTEALSKVNTWHLKGWRLLDGKQEIWEVWGSRNPFFYREQIGERIVIDDGIYRIQSIPPDAGMHRPTGIYLKTPALPLERTSPWLYDSMVREWRGYGAAKPWQDTGENAIFRSVARGMVGPGAVNETLFTVDKQTKLPIQYELKRTLKGEQPITAEILRTEFNVAITKAVAEQPAPAAGYDLFDATEPPSSDLPAHNAATLKGMTVQATPLAMDRGGNVLLEIQCWIGNKLVRQPSVLNFHVEPGREGRRSRPFSPGLESFIDDRNRTYVKVNVDPISFFSGRNGNSLMFVAPLEPIPGSQPLPAKMRMTLWTNVSIPARASGTNSLMTSANVLSQDISLVARMPASPRRIDIDSYLEPNWRQRIRFAEEIPLTAEIARARAHRYMGGISEAVMPAYGAEDPDYSLGPQFPGRIDREKLHLSAKRGASWMRETIRLLPRDSKFARLTRGRLIQHMSYAANWMIRAGDKAGAREFLTAVLRETKRHPTGTGRWRKRAEKQLAELNSR